MEYVSKSLSTQGDQHGVLYVLYRTKKPSAFNIVAAAAAAAAAALLVATILMPS